MVIAVSGNPIAFSSLMKPATTVPSTLAFVQSCFCQSCFCRIRTGGRFILAVVWLWLGGATVVVTVVGAGETFFVAVDGSDENRGTIDSPFASIQRSQLAVEPGDTVLIRGGTYVISESQIARKQRIVANVIDLNKSGAEGKPIRYQAYGNEQPIFDFSNVKPAGLRVHAFSVSGSWLHLVGLEVVGVQVTTKTHTQSICFANDGSDNVFERLSMHDGHAIGIYSVRGSVNLFLNCDAYRDYDPVSENDKGGTSMDSDVTGGKGIAAMYSEVVERGSIVTMGLIASWRLSR
tara:strand:- start:12571 stop:13443 length:873 start_codon:yes stop_codon:yes gene_type:complete